jgi:hypothetical protein
MENTLKITRLDEQMKQVDKKLDSLDKKIDKEFAELKSELKCYVRKEEFATVKSIVYGMVGAILTAFIGGLIYIVFK